MNVKESVSDREIVVTRVINAPLEKVWDACVDPKKIVLWWGPNGFTNSTKKMDVRKGGEWDFIMHGPDGRDYPNHIVYTDIVEHKLIAHDHGGDDGKVFFKATMTFEREGDKTRVTMRSVFATRQDRDFVVREYGALEGAEQNLARLERFLKYPKRSSARAFTISRVFNAPRQRVWDAWTKESQLMAWFGPKGVSMTYAKLDFRPGGTFHYAMKGPDGTDMWGRWLFQEITPPEQIVLIQHFSDKNGGVTTHPFAANWPRFTLSTTDFSEKDGKTTITLEWAAYDATPEEVAAFDAGRAGMTQGWGGTLDLLEQYLVDSQKMR